VADFNAGWYPDPSGDPSRLRYWDGSGWTDYYSNVMPAQTPQPGYGSLYQPQIQQSVQPARKNPGKGLGVASLVLGIVGIFTALSTVSGAANSTLYYGIAYELGYFIGGSLPSIVGLILGIVGWRRSLAVKMPHGMALAGFIISVAVLALELFVFISLVVYM